MVIVYRIICILIGYIFGIFQTGYIYGKLHHIDIRDYGSHNSGTTNVSRIFGKKIGTLTYFMDAIKGLLALLLVRLLCHAEIFDLSLAADEGAFFYILSMYTGIGVVLGHNYPFYMGFKGGKGIAASSGVIFGMFQWIIFWCCFILFFGTTLPSKYVSLGSIVMMTAYFILTVILGQMDLLPVTKASGMLPEIYILAFIFSGMAIWKHRENIKRLINGTESKIFQKSKKTLIEQGVVNLEDKK
ncbi:MAG: glycerol-3-phosphate 1-O-acyltransferase PlsY [Lachnospiraceae bacterium]|nr:glycerol-3-phosphate 1-O-acyltransferase PlsY [Lachnospiraceae bacterium]